MLQITKSKYPHTYCSSSISSTISIIENTALSKASTRKESDNIPKIIQLKLHLFANILEDYVIIQNKFLKLSPATFLLNFRADTKQRYEHEDR